MRIPRPSAWSAALFALALASVADARPATLKDRARLRAGPASTTDLLGEIAPGVTVEIVGESGGWREVRTPDGQSGYIWHEHFTEGTPDAAAPAVEAPPRRDSAPTPPPAGRTLVDEIRSLRDDVATLRDRPAPATSADVERLRTEVERLASAQQILARRLDERLIPATDPPPPEAPLAGLGPLIFLIGGGVGWSLGRLMLRRRDSRQRGRIRI